MLLAVITLGVADVVMLAVQLSGPAHVSGIVGGALFPSTLLPVTGVVALHHPVAFRVTSVEEVDVVAVGQAEVEQTARVARVAVLGHALLGGREHVDVVAVEQTEVD